MAHIPVLLNEVIEVMAPKTGETYLDCTFGGGGYSEALLKTGAKVIAVDQDPTVREAAERLKSVYGENFDFSNTNFSEITVKLIKNKQVNGIVMDLGVSSEQIDLPERGFSFAKEGKLDMRMSMSGMSAADFINSADETTLADIIFNYGDEPASRRIAKAIVESRLNAPITTTLELADIVRKAIVFRPSKIDLATKTFQAIRIHVNQELKVLEDFLSKVPELLQIGGRLGVVTFHSLEDRIVKNYLKNNIAKKVARSKYAKIDDTDPAIFKLINAKPIIAGSAELHNNIRARSAKLRGAIKVKERI